MLKIKVHIARILCLLVIILISSNIGFSAYHFNPSLQKKHYKEQSTSAPDRHQFVDQDDNKQIITLIKDQQEFDIDLDCEEVFQAIFIQFFLGNIQHSQWFTYHSPELFSRPLWIKHLQIRL